MKKNLFTGVLFLLFTFALSAYNPPANGETFTELSSPRLLSNASSSCGGPVFYSSADSISVNPALPTAEQLIKINLAYTALASFNPAESHHFGSAIQTGAIFPTKYCVITTYLNGVFSPFDSMNLGNSLNFKAGLAKEITDKMNLGLTLNSGVCWGTNVDWSLSSNIGILYNFGTLGFIKDFRYGLAINNLGKNYDKADLTNPIKGDGKKSVFPTVGTVRTGIAGLLLSTDVVKLGFALDLSTPLFQNLIIDGGIQLAIKDWFAVTVSDRFNLAEYATGHIDIIPSVGVSFKFSFSLDNNQYLKEKGWEDIHSDGVVAYKMLYKDVQALSAGVDLCLGKKDVSKPVIQIFIDEGDDE